MPELPEVEIVRRGLEPVMNGVVLEKIEVRRRDLRQPIPASFEKSLGGQRIVRLERRGKYIIGITASGAGFVMHLGMSGRVRIYHPDQVLKPEKHDHVLFMMQGGVRVVFNDPRRFGMIYGIREEEWQNQAPFSKMGAEPLGNGFSGAQLLERLAGRSTPIKTCLLNQEVVAGVGNIYACEALYDARIHPLTPAGTLDAEASERLVRAIRAVLVRAIEAGGSSLKDYRHPDDGLGYFQHQFSVYDREGARCGDCQCDPLKTGGVRRIVQAGRSTFYCDALQSRVPVPKAGTKTKKGKKKA
jgi:formamidopyrimidine-DNA glycosylase